MLALVISTLNVYELLATMGKIKLYQKIWTPVGWAQEEEVLNRFWHFSEVEEVSWCQSIVKDETRF